ncbi:MAG: glycosyltransferase [Pseudomonadota bacterium]
MARIDQASKPSLGVAIITHNARRHLTQCLTPLLQSRLRPRVLVVNSSSPDGTVELAAELGAETLVVPREKFNHGLTREDARRQLATDITVFLTPDAYPSEESFLERITAPLVTGQASVAYGRQLARSDADFIERFARDFNYPRQSQLRGLNDWPRFGSYTHFCSNSCAAWNNAALDSIGGFQPTLVSEETIAVAQLLRRGHKIAYAADATVVHSHPTSLIGDFKRQFDIGFARAQHRALLLAYEPDERRGHSYAWQLLTRCLTDRPTLLPYAVTDTAVKYVGYRLGLLGRKLPGALRRLASGQDYFWTSTVRLPG